MQCVILAAGKGTRMRELTADTPKPLLTVCGKPILDHIIEALPVEVDEVILVVSYLKEQFFAYCGDSHLGKKITYVEQSNPAGGTGDALLSARPFLNGTFMVLNGDDIHGPAILDQAAKEPQAIIAVHTDTPELFGVLIPSEDGSLQEIIEKPENPPSNFVNTGGFVASLELFDTEVPVASSGELYATDMLTEYAKTHSVKIIEQDMWLPIGSPEQLKQAEAKLCP